MRITCPKCMFKGLIDTAPLTFETRVACVRCGTTFYALLVEGELQTSLPPDEVENLLREATALDANDLAAPPDADAEDVLALPQTPDASEQIIEAAAVFEDVLPVPPAEAEPMAEYELLAAPPEVNFEAATAEAEGCGAQSLDEQPAETVETDVETDDDAPSFDFGQPRVESAAEDERHGMGMRLMRISPLWLLACGMTFISVIIFSNQFAKPAEPGHLASANFTSSSNKSTNQSSAQPLAPAATNSAATSVADASQPPAPASVEPKSEAKVIEKQVEAQAQDEPKAAAPSAAPVVEKKNEPVEPVDTAPQTEDAEAGGLTIQIGSYNVIEQANERVARLQAAGFDAHVVAVELPKRGTWYRVQAGRFSSREEAQRYGNELRAKGAADNFIVTPAQGGR